MAPKSTVKKVYIPPSILQPGGHLGAGEPATMPDTILAIYLGAYGETLRDEMEVFETDQDVVGAVEWASIVSWVPLAPSS